MDNFVFFITRYVNSELTNNYWIESYNCIRKIYPDIKIIIIDDNSNYDFVSYNEKLINVEIIQSEYPRSGELLPYYYFFKKNNAKKAIIIHDSLFIKNKIDIDNIDKVKFLWHHYHIWNNIEEETKLIKQLNNFDDLLNLYNDTNKWVLCFGVMSVINYDFLLILENKYNFFNLLNFIKNRDDRMCLERIFGLLCHSEYEELINNPSIFGINNNSGNYYSFNDYLNDYLNEPVKVYTGR